MEFLTFDRFISIPLLIGIYYLGALFLPIVLWIQRERIKQVVNTLLHHAPVATSRILWIFSIVFIITEVFWRMMFEMIIGYFQMREYLQHIVG